jgi:NAD(P)-dependent dehydrogenase (short-subunit alcohol dehydrogenase family)
LLSAGDKSRRKRSPMADEFGRSGVRVNAMQAGPTETPSRFTRGTKFSVGQALTGRFERLKGYFFSAQLLRVDAIRRL